MSPSCRPRIDPILPRSGGAKIGAGIFLGAVVNAAECYGMESRLVRFLACPKYLAAILPVRIPCQAKDTSTQKSTAPPKYHDSRTCVLPFDRTIASRTGRQSHERPWGIYAVP